MDKLLTATVISKPSNVIATKYGDKRVVTLNTTENEEVKVWFTGDDLANLEKGQQVKLLGKKIVDVLQNTTNKTQVEPKKRISTIPKEVKMAIAEHTADQLDVYRFIFESTKEKFNDVEGISTEDIRTIATSVYIGTQRKFNL